MSNANIYERIKVLANTLLDTDDRNPPPTELLDIIEIVGAELAKQSGQSAPSVADRHFRMRILPPTGNRQAWGINIGQYVYYEVPQGQSLSEVVIMYDNKTNHLLDTLENNMCRVRGADLNVSFVSVKDVIADLLAQTGEQP